MSPGPILSVLVLALAAAADASAADYVVDISKMAFGPMPPHLVVGDTIEWKNSDIFRHTVTARTKAFDLDLQPRTSGRTTLKDAGTFEVYCRFHPTMKATLNVTAK